MVRPVRVSETRYFSPGEDKATANAMRSGMFLQPSTVTILLELKGKAVSSASQYGELRVTTAKHDGGTLKVAPRMGMVDITKEFTIIEHRHGEDIERPDGMTVAVTLEAPPRSATQLTVVEGSVKLLAGESEEVELAGIVGKLGNQTNKTLTAAGLKLTTLKATKEQAENPANALVIQVSGDVQKLADIWLVTAQDAEVDTSFSSSADPAGKTTTFVFEADKPLPKDIKLMLEVIPKLEKIDVPFKLSNLKLP